MEQQKKFNLNMRRDFDKWTKKCNEMMRQSADGELPQQIKMMILKYQLDDWYKIFLKYEGQDKINKLEEFTRLLLDKYTTKRIMHKNEETKEIEEFKETNE